MEKLLKQKGANYFLAKLLFGKEFNIMIYLDYTIKRIKHSAEKIFYEKGFNGARVSEIAKDAEVSKSLLHYYFRTKEQIFRIIIEDSINLVVKNVSPILTKDLGFYELIDQFISYIRIIRICCHLSLMSTTKTLIR